jgi:hypothetical protein
MADLKRIKQQRSNGEPASLPGAFEASEGPAENVRNDGGTRTGCFTMTMRRRTLLCLCGDFLAAKNMAVVPHPPYSPDLAPSDFFLFLRMKSKLKVRRFQNISEILE